MGSQLNRLGIDFHCNLEIYKKMPKLSNKQLILLLACLCLFSTNAEAGPIAWGVCQTACNAAYVVCVGAAGGTAGVAAPPALIPALALCSTAQGTCMTACTPLLVAPTP